MAGLITFLNSFLSYFLVVGVFSVLAVVAVLLGIKLRKNKNLKDVDKQETLAENR